MYSIAIDGPAGAGKTRNGKEKLNEVQEES